MCKKLLSKTVKLTISVLKYSTVHFPYRHKWVTIMFVLHKSVLGFMIKKNPIAKTFWTS